MKRLLLIATFALISLSAFAQQKDPIYIVNGRAVTAEELNELRDRIESVTVIRDAEQLKLYEQFGDTSNGVAIISLLDEHVWIAPENPGSFMGGNIQTFYIWVMENIRYPEDMKKQQKEAKFAVQFVIGKQGNVVPNSIMFLEPSEKAFEDEVRRVLLSSPRWEPATQNGEAVAVQYMLPINFCLK